MNRNQFVEVRPNIWISKSDPFYEQKLIEYSANTKTSGHLVTDTTPEHIKKFVPEPSFSKKPNLANTLQRAKTSSIANSETPLANNRRPTRSERNRSQQINSFSLAQFFKTWLSVALFLGFFASATFLMFYFLIFYQLD